MVLTIGEQPLCSVSLTISKHRPSLTLRPSLLLLRPFQRRRRRRRLASSSPTPPIQHLNNTQSQPDDPNWADGGQERFDFERELESSIIYNAIPSESVSLEVKELEELPENWRRSKLAWLCKEVSAHKSPTMIRLLNSQKKWMTQEDAMYVAIHGMRIRENEAGFWVSLRFYSFQD